ncbi:MAG: pyridoxamine 5'-phosphate oxidase family protein [Acidimicrobiia bacterium]
MTDIAAVARVVAAWTGALGDPEGAVTVLVPVLSPAVVGAFPTDAAEGPDAVARAAASPRLLAAMDGAVWSEPVVDGSTVRIRATAPAGAVIGGLEVAFGVDDGLVTRVDQTLVPAPPAEIRPVSLLGPVAEAIDDALAKAVPVVVAYVDADGQPSLSLRGSVKVNSDTELQIWIRKAEGGLAGALAANDRLTFWYRNTAERATLQIKGRGRVVADEATRQAIYDSTVEPERRADAQCKGVGVLVEVDRVDGRLASGGVRMVRPG